MNKNTILKFLLVIAHILGVFFSLYSMCALIDTLYNILKMSNFNSQFEIFSSFLSIGSFLGLPIIGLFVIFKGKTKKEKRIGYLYLLFWICFLYCFHLEDRK
jgi:hypothetical protein